MKAHPTAERLQERINTLRSEHRAKLYVIQKEVLWGIFESGLGEPKLTYGFEGIPEDAIVDNVGWDYMHNGIVYRVLHESFEPIQEGTTPKMEPITVTVKRND